MQKNLSSQTLINIKKVWKSHQTSDGNGVLLNRVINNRSVKYLDPFLMLDHLESISLPQGFPDHMHRGFETVTYITKGSFLHEDFKGNKGQLNAGDVQWMTAGRGIVHSEIPASYEQSAGFQLWIDLKKENKMCEPRYQEIKSDKFPIVKCKKGNYEVKIISGKFEDQIGSCISDNPTSFFDIKLSKNKEILIPINEYCNGFIYIFEGEKGVSIENENICRLHAGSFYNETNSEIKNLLVKSNEDDVRFLLIFGKPFNQPVCQGGPVVMCTQEDINEAFMDYQKGRNGFENAKNWKSENSKLVEG